MDALIHLLNEYGYIVLFFSLMLQLIIIPIPSEALMSYVGVLAFQGKMNLILALLSAVSGGIIGASISYWIGYKLGVPFINKYGRYLHMGPEKMAKMEIWYKKYGKVLLLVSYIIPGICHIASILSGIIKLPYRSFAVFSYIGVFLWAGLYIFLGYLLGPKWNQYQSEIEKWLVLGGIVVGIGVLAFIVIKANRQYVKESTLLIFQATFKQFGSFFKTKILILEILLFFAILFALMVRMIQAMIAHQFGQFNTFCRNIVFFLFTPGWHGIMYAVYDLSSVKNLSIVGVLTVLAIVFNRKNIWLELLFFAITILGTLLFSSGIHWLFHFLFSNISAQFPDAPAMLLVSILSFFFIMLIRHYRNYHIIFVLLVCFISILTAYFISGVYIMHAEPSDIMAGYLFSAVWVSGMLFALETFRFLSLLKKELKDSDRK
jgi:membrane protein DedA with SNARE-associated domain